MTCTALAHVHQPRNAHVEGFRVRKTLLFWLETRETAQNAINASISEGFLQGPQLRRRLCSQLRFCPRCMARGYRSVGHQFGSVPYCPVHGCCLATRCRSCGAASEYFIKASVLDAPFRCPYCRRSNGNESASFAYRIPWPPLDSGRHLSDLHRLKNRRKQGFCRPGTVTQLLSRTL
jgi:hypothetical protein